MTTSLYSATKKTSLNAVVVDQDGEDGEGDARGDDRRPGEDFFEWQERKQQEERENRGQGRTRRQGHGHSEDEDEDEDEELQFEEDGNAFVSPQQGPSRAISLDPSVSTSCFFFALPFCFFLARTPLSPRLFQPWEPPSFLS